MKLNIAATTRAESICSGRLAGVTKRVAENCGNDAETVIAKLKEMAESAFAFEAQSETVGEYRISQEVRGGSPWFEVARRVIVTPAETIEVADASEAMAICKARSPGHGVCKTEGGKRNRIDGSGKIHTCGTAPGFGFPESVIGNTVPVIAFFDSRLVSATLY